MDELTTYQILDRIYYVLDSIMLLPIVIGIYKRKFLSKPEMYILGLLLCTLFLEIISETLRWNRIRNHFINYPITFVLYFFTIQFFEILNETLLKPKKIIIVLFLFFIIIEVFLVGFNQINSFTISFAYLLMFVLGIRYLKKYFSTKEIPKHSLQSYFWFSIALSIWGAFAFLPSLLQKYFIETSIPLYYFFDTVRMLGFAAACVIFVIGFSNVTKLNKL